MSLKSVKIDEMQVRICMWRQPRYQLFHNGNWFAVDSLPKAREYAEKYGYSGITVSCV